MFGLILLGILGLLPTYIHAQTFSTEITWVQRAIVVGVNNDILIYDDHLQFLGGLYNLAEYGVLEGVRPSPDGKYVAVLIYDATAPNYRTSVQIWNLTQQSLVHSFHDVRVGSKAYDWSPDGRFFAIHYGSSDFLAGDRRYTLSLYSLETNSILHSFKTQGNGLSLVWTKGNYLGVFDNDLSVWLVGSLPPYTLTFIGTYPLVEAYSNDVIVNDIVASSESAQFALASENLVLDTYRIEIIDAATLQVIKTLSVHQSVVRLDWLTNSFLGYFRDSKLAFVDEETGALLSSFNPGQFTSLNSYAASPDGTKIMVTDEMGIGTIYSSTGEVLHTRDIAADVEAVDLTPIPAPR